ncbi:MAG: luciferase family protein [Solirubrobacterales bacterium]
MLGLLVGCGDDSEAGPAAGEASPDQRAEQEIPDGPALGVPRRPGPPPEVTDGIPHIQRSDNASAGLQRALGDWVFGLEGVVEAPSQASLPGARGLTVSSELTPRPEAIIAGREFAHIHPGGSLHLTLPMSQAEQVVAQGWGEWHPFAISGSLPGLVMVYAPRSRDDLNSVQTIIEASVDFSSTGGAQEAQ